MATSRRSPRAAFFHLFDDSATPVYALDAKRRLIYCNAALAAWLNSDAEALVGSVQNFGGAAGVTHSLGAPPSVLDGSATEVLGTVSCQRGDGSTEIRSAVFAPLENEKSDLQGVVVLVGKRVSQTGAVTARSDDGPVELHRQIMQFREPYRGEYVLDRLIGHSSAIQLVRDRVELATQSPARVVVTGPSGSGRERVARTIHYQTRDERLPALVPLDCPLLDAELLQTTITAFLQQSAELQIGGVPCLLLLEVDQLSTDAQDVLHKFLSVDEFELRTVSTARVPLAEAVASGFRADVAATLSTLTIRLPSLSERLEDIPILFQFALEERNRQGEKQVEGVSDQATRQLIQYPWPGNVDELNRIAREVHATTPNAIVGVEDLPKQIRLGIDADEYPIVEVEAVELDDVLESVERELVTRAMRQAGGNKAQAARLLGMNRARLLRRLAHLKIEI